MRAFGVGVYGKSLGNRMLKGQRVETQREFELG